MVLDRFERLLSLVIHTFKAGPKGSSGALLTFRLLASRGPASPPEDGPVVLQRRGCPLFDHALFLGLLERHEIPAVGITALLQLPSQGFDDVVRLGLIGNVRK